MDIFVYFYSQLPASKDMIEDVLERCLGNRGEVTGSGIGKRGANIDIEVFSEEDAPLVLSDVQRVLKDLRVPHDTVLVIDGERQNLWP